MNAQDELVFLPLGGSGEIGMNLNAYGFGPPDQRKWIIVDIGVTFGRDDTPGIDVILPDPAFLEEYKDDVLAIVLTHAHEDHIGAIGWLWPRFKAPVYATPFTAALVRDKLRERGVLDRVKLHVVELQSRFHIGPFDIEMVTLTHSIPEPNGLAIRTPLGLVWHTGDWKIDPNPLIGETTDEVALNRMADEGVLAMVCDSTNVFVEGESGSEADVRDHLTSLIAKLQGRVAVTAFASNVARVESVMHAARACGRSVCLVGRSMHRITNAARSVGLLADVPTPISEEEAAISDPSRVLYLCTGSQGEPRAALARIASGAHRTVRIGAGDTVIFSSRVIPGNEHAIHAVQDALERSGANIITDAQEHVHVSGHPARDELKCMYEWARPQIAIPVHGERRHIIEHQALALSLQTPQALAPRNGDLIKLAPGLACIIDEVPSGRLYVDGQTLVEAGSDALNERLRMGAEGTLTIALAVNAKSRTIASGPEVRSRGLPMVDEEAFEEGLQEVEDAAEAAFLRLSADDRDDDDAAEAAIVRTVRKASERVWGKRPLVDVVIMRI